MSLQQSSRMIFFTLTALSFAACKSATRRGAPDISAVQSDQSEGRVIFDFGNGKVNAPNTEAELQGLSFRYKGGEGGLVNTAFEDGKMLFMSSLGGGTPNSTYDVFGIFSPNVPLPKGVYALELSGDVRDAQVALVLGNGVNIDLTVNTTSDANARRTLDRLANFISSRRGQSRIYISIPYDMELSIFTFKRTGLGSGIQIRPSERALDLKIGKLMYISP